MNPSYAVDASCQCVCNQRELANGQKSGAAQAAPAAPLHTALHPYIPLQMIFPLVQHDYVLYAMRLLCVSFPCSYYHKIVMCIISVDHAL